MVMPLALASSIAMRVPLSLSLPIKAWLPVNGAAAPMRTTNSPDAAAWSEADLPQPAKVKNIVVNNSERVK